MQTLLSPQIANFVQLIKKGNQFINLVNYTSGTTNKKCLIPEISNYNLSLGASYKNAKVKSLEILANANYKDKGWEYIENEEQFNKIVSTIYAQTETPNKKLSDSQKNTYIHLVDGKVKFHPEKGRMYIFAKLNSKTRIQKGKFLPTNSRLSTKQKKEIREFYDLPHLKFRIFAFDVMNIAKIEKQTIVF